MDFWIHLSTTTIKSKNIERIPLLFQDFCERAVALLLEELFCWPAGLEILDGHVIKTGYSQAWQKRRGGVGIGAADVPGSASTMGGFSAKQVRLLVVP